MKLSKKGLKAVWILWLFAAACFGIAWGFQALLEYAVAHWTQTQFKTGFGIIVLCALVWFSFGIYRMISRGDAPLAKEANDAAK